MNNNEPMSRRDFLRFTGIGAVSLYTVTQLNTVFAARFPTRLLTQKNSPDVEITLAAVQKEAQILPGSPTRVWSYEGAVVSGDANALQPVPNSYLGPTFRVRRGQNVRVNFTNNLPQPTIIHWHGLRLPEEMDAHPKYAIEPGQTYTYDFQVLNRAGTYWYHPHPDLLTGEQAYNGLAGLFIVSDDEEDAAGLPGGAYDIPLVIQDRSFDVGNQLVYIPENMRQETMGFLGDRILVDGQPDFTLPVETRAYRLRLLNGSNSRIYKLGWENASPLTVIGTDGGLLETPVQRDYVTLAPGERLDLWADFSQYPLGTELRLKSLAISGIEAVRMETEDEDDGMEMEGMNMESEPDPEQPEGMEMEGSALPQGTEFPVLSVRVEQQAGENQPLPTRLSTFESYRLADAVNSASPRRFTLSRGDQAWLINGRSFVMDEVDDNEIVPINTLEVWEFDNLLEGDDQMAHPMHIHGVQFQVLSREIASETRGGWETVRAGYVDEGWKDTVLIMPGERVRVLLKFEDFPGLFVYHCHNLEHEDRGMMRNILVQS